ncbi:MAG: hypothetical protein JNM59_11885 [Hyphomonadaceae bacterium]|nr:hypothetical protein [Hyphomonadaceae bacterium]
MSDESPWARRLAVLRQGIAHAWRRAVVFVSELTPRQKLIGGGVIAVVVLTLALTSFGGRNVSVNGQRLSREEIALLEANLGAHLPNGDYWLDPNTMQLQVVGNMQPYAASNGAKPQAGRPTYDPYSAQQQMQALQQQQYEQMLAEQYQQQMLAQQYQQQQSWGDVGQNDRGPFGDYMSDGECSFVNGVPVGNC